MRRVYFTLFFVILISILIGCSNKIISQNHINYNSLKKEFSINDKDFKKIKDNEALIKELKLSIKDSLTKSKASSILKSFFNENYTQKRLLTILEINRIFKGKNFEIVDTKDIDSSKALIINDVSGLEKLKDKMKNIKVKTRTDTLKTKN